MATRFQLINRPEFPPIDLLWVSPETFAKMAMTDQRTGLHGNIPVIDLESLLAMKLHALKDQDEREGKDLLAITEPRLHALCERFAGPHAYAIIRQIA